MPAIELSDYQKRGAVFALNQRRVGLFFDPGLGKTSTVLAAFCALKKKNPLAKMLVIAPLRPAQVVWRQEAGKWDQFSRLSVELLHGKDKAARFRRDADVAVINYEGLPWLLDQVPECPYDVIVFDESTLLKNPRSKRFKLIQPWAFTAQYVWLLTGTPRPRTVEDLWPQMYLLDAGKALEKNITRFRQKYLYPVRARGHVVYEYGLRYGAEEAIQKAIAPRVMRLKAEDYLELPDFVFREIPVTLPPGAAKQYRNMQRELFAELESGNEVVALSEGSAYGKCKQMSGGALYGEDDSIEHIHNAKTDALKELLESINEPVLVAIQYRHEVERVCAAIKSVTGVEPPTVVSGTKTNVEALAEQWNTGKVPAVVVHPASLSHGANLQEAGMGIVWFSLTDNLEHYDQLNRRLRRRGREKPVFIWSLVAEGTVDSAIAARNADKSKKQQTMLDALNTFRETVCRSI